MVIEEGTTRRMAVQPVVVFPGWFVEVPVGAQRDVWVMEPKGLPAFLERTPQRLNADVIALVAKGIAVQIRGYEKQRMGKKK